MVCWEMGWFLRFGESNDRSLAKVHVGRRGAPENGERRTERAAVKPQPFHGHRTFLRGDGQTKPPTFQTSSPPSDL